MTVSIDAEPWWIFHAWLQESSAAQRNANGCTDVILASYVSVADAAFAAVSVNWVVTKVVRRIVRLYID